MDSAAVLSYSLPMKASGRVEVMPSPVLELAYALFLLGHPHNRGRINELGWASELALSHPELIATIKGLWADHAESSACPPGFELLVMVCQLGYARDVTTERFLLELPGLPERAIGQAPPGGANEEKNNIWQGVLRRFELLQNEATMRSYHETLKELWSLLTTYWQREGESAVMRESERIKEQLSTNRVLLEALPRHTFIRSEGAMDKIAKFSESGNILVTPLFFASTGGLILDFDNTLFLGYGLISDLSHQRLVREVEGAASRMKAFSDPTRLMILTLIARGPVTVGDLANRLEVSQPTVSGHLKLLRDEGLVQVEKKGNKSYYRVHEETVDKSVEKLVELLARD